jgi:CRP/FNR family transcriptional regulator, cyclic AMP receptor protein
MPKKPPPFDPHVFLSKIGNGKTILEVRKRGLVFSQGDAADAVFYIQTGKVKLSVVSAQGKEAVVGILESASFLGEGCLIAGRSVRMATASAMSDTSIVRIPKETMLRVLHEEPTFSTLFMNYVLAHKIRVEEDLVDQLFNSSEKRLARTLLLLAHFGKEGTTDTAIANVSQETLAEMIGTTRSRVSFFMNKFRKLGFLDYNGQLRVHSSLLTVILHD